MLMWEHTHSFTLMRRRLKMPTEKETQTLRVLTYLILYAVHGSSGGEKGKIKSSCHTYTYATLIIWNINDQIDEEREEFSHINIIRHFLEYMQTRSTHKSICTTRSNTQARAVYERASERRGEEKEKKINKNLFQYMIGLWIELLERNFLAKREIFLGYDQQRIVCAFKILREKNENFRIICIKEIDSGCTSKISWRKMF